MKFNVSEILFQKAGFVSSLNIEDYIRVGDKDLFVVGRGEFLRTDKGIWVNARIDTEIEIECGRCLNKFPFGINFDVEEEVFPSSGFTSESVLEKEEQVGISLIDANNMLDISNMVVQYIDISMPITVKCDVQCKGLCVRCGINLNSNSCKCQTDSINDGWNILSTTRIIERKQEN
tara:strand:+ start:1305 stop:1832 length:528 start_codon:yes stop_codon:yes gene_type:complete